MNILFLCDGKKCKVCHKSQCSHTTDVAHAAKMPKDVKEWFEDNFKLDEKCDVLFQEEIILH